MPFGGIFDKLLMNVVCRSFVFPRYGRQLAGTFGEGLAPSAFAQVILVRSNSNDNT